LKKVLLQFFKLSLSEMVRQGTSELLKLALEGEIEYFKNGGILPTVLKKLAK